MTLIDCNYPCFLSKITFDYIVELFNDIPKSFFRYDEIYIAFVDGDSKTIHGVLNHIYDMKKSGKIVFIVTLLSKVRSCSPVLRHLSDSILDKKIGYSDLEKTIGLMINSEPKVLADNIFGDIWDDILKSSQKEFKVLKLLLEGHSQYQISKMLNISIKTVSSYKVRAVKRYGVRNFNELYIQKLHGHFE